MLNADLDQFWKDDEIAHKDNCFSLEAPQVALEIRMNEECVFSELGEEGEPWGWTPVERRKELNKRYNDKAGKIVGKRRKWAAYQQNRFGYVTPSSAIGEIRFNRM